MKSKFILFSIVICLGLGVLGFFYHKALWTFVLVGPIVLLGMKDVLQTKHSLIHNFPLVGRMRWWAEWMRPKVYLYIIESDTDGAPYNRLSRNVSVSFKRFIAGSSVSKWMGVGCDAQQRRNIF